MFNRIPTVSNFAVCSELEAYCENWTLNKVLLSVWQEYVHNFPAYLN